MFAANPNPLDPGAIAGLGIGFMILGIVLYLGLIALMLWISYLIMRTAVKNGVIMAMRETGTAFAPRPGQPPHAPQAPGSWAPPGS